MQKKKFNVRLLITIIVNVVLVGNIICSVFCMKFLEYLETSQMGQGNVEYSVFGEAFKNGFVFGLFSTQAIMLIVFNIIMITISVRRKRVNKR